MAAKKTAAKKRTAKKAPAKKAAAKPTSGKAISSRYSKTQILTEIAESTDLSRKQVGAVIDELSSLIDRHVKKRGCGEFVLPGMLKITTVKKPAKKARKGINPFTGEETMFKAKPASIAVKVRPLKKLKEMAG
jgi:nucleoid DNA-binding protein